MPKGFELVQRSQTKRHSGTCTFLKFHSFNDDLCTQAVVFCYTLRMRG